MREMMMMKRKDRGMYVWRGRKEEMERVCAREGHAGDQIIFGLQNRENRGRV
jgi:hypothetical protein